MAKKVTIDNLDDEIKKILKEYEDNVSSNLTEITKKVGRAGVQALKSESRQTFGTSKNKRRKYADTWTSQTEVGRLYSTVTIYNSQPGLPHLLENGHAKVGGGRVAGRAHISTVENKLIQEYESEVVSKL